MLLFSDDELKLHVDSLLHVEAQAFPKLNHGSRWLQRLCAHCAPRADLARASNDEGKRIGTWE